MCSGGSSSNSDQTAVEQQQVVQQAQDNAAQLAEQQREFDAQQAQAAQTLADQQAQEAAQAAQLAQQAQLADTWQTGRAAEEQSATNSIDQAFSSFTPDYYNKYIQDYENNYDPQIQSQANTAQNQITYGLARTGNLDSQTGANQNQALQQQVGIQQDDVANQAQAAATTLQNNVNTSKTNLLNSATSDATLGSPVTPGSADAINAQFNATASALSGINTQAGDQVTTLQATPSYSSLGTLFAGAAQSGQAAVAGNNSYLYGQAYNNSLSGASNPNSSSATTT
jgi:hypothetical protein